MAALIKAINAKIRSNPISDYIYSTHFWGPVSNFGIPLAAVMDIQKSPEFISGQFTGVLIIYFYTFMRYSLAVTPRNYLLFACHFVNAGAQLTQGYRWLSYHHKGGKGNSAEEHSTKAVEVAKPNVEEAGEKNMIVR